MLDEDKISAIVLESAIEVHKEMGPGLLESVYEEALCFELFSRGLTVRSQVRRPIYYKGEKLAKEFIIDILINECVILELKSVEETLPVHKKQLLTFLKLSNIKLGMLINFNVPLLKHGVSRVVNGL